MKQRLGLLIPIQRSLDEKLEDYEVDQNGCWLWLGACSTGGYARIAYPEPPWRLAQGHRLNYERKVGPIPDGMELDHTCHNAAAQRGECAGGPTCEHRRCINPAHLEPVTPSVNSQRGIESGGAKFQRNKTHCPAGHPYDDVNTVYLKKPGGKVERRCHTCHNETARRYRARKANRTANS